MTSLQLTNILLSTLYNGLSVFDLLQAPQLQKKAANRIHCLSFFCCRRIMVMPRFSTTNQGEKVKSLGIFLQCDPEGEGSSWSCQASAKISVLNHKNPEDTFARSKFLQCTITLIEEASSHRRILRVILCGSDFVVSLCRNLKSTT